MRAQHLAPPQNLATPNNQRVPVQVVARDHRREHAEEHMRHQRAATLQMRRLQNGEHGEEGKELQVRVFKTALDEGISFLPKPPRTK